MNTVDILVLVGAVGVGVVAPKLPSLLNKALKKLKGKQKQDVVVDSLSAVNSVLVNVVQGLNSVKYELDDVKGKLQSIDQELKQVKQDNNIVVSGLGSADTKLTKVEQAATQSVAAVNKLAELVSKIIEAISRNNRSVKGESSNENNQY